MKLIIGLGNPSSRYSNTRHNAGFMAVDHLAKLHKLKFAIDAQSQAEVATGLDFILAKPTTFMNNSGVAAAKLMRKHRLSPADLLVMYDDVDLPVGVFRYRPHGSSGGQNGMKSIIDILDTREIPRIRIGIGKPARTQNGGGDASKDTADYVLAKFSPEDKTAVAEVFTKISDKLQDYL
jgi:PTH1 family peptidyl-tRNA hydrolase